jgi:hypothetical protein
MGFKNFNGRMEICPAGFGLRGLYPTLHATVDKLVKSPAFQAGICEFKSRRWRQSYFSDTGSWQNGIAADCKSVALRQRVFDPLTTHHF